MSEPSLTFPAEEFRERAKRLQAQMVEGGADALLLTTPADIFYVTGFLTQFWESPARPWFVILPATGGPIAVIPSIGAALMARSWVRDIRTWDAPDPRDDGITLLCATLGDLVPCEGRIAVPMGLETYLRMPLAGYHTLRDRLAPRSWICGTSIVQQVREIKSQAEVARIRATCDLTARAFSRLPDIASAGRPLDAVFRGFQSLLLDEGADWVSYVAGASGHGGYDDVISPAGSEPLATGDVLMLDTGAVRQGYFCDFNRNAAVGHPSGSVERTHAALWEATEDALTQIRAGMRACDVHALLHDALLRRGVRPCGGRLGHGLGINLTEWPSFTPLDKTPLRAGMVLTLEPSAYVEGTRLIVHEENIHLTGDGAELLSPRAPEKMPVI